MVQLPLSIPVTPYFAFPWRGLDPKIPSVFTWHLGLILFFVINGSLLEREKREDTVVQTFNTMFCK